MDQNGMNYTILCPQQDDSMLSKAASWVGIITFISTTLGGFTIFYTLYQSFQTAQGEILTYAATIERYGQKLIEDLFAMHAIIEQHEEGAEIFDDVRSLKDHADNLHIQLETFKTQQPGLRKNFAIYKFGRDNAVKNSMAELDRLTRSLEGTKVNLIMKQV